MLHRELKLTPTGSAGAATATGLFDSAPGRVHAISIVYAGQPGTTDISITDAELANDVILATVNGNTSKTYYPREAASKSADGTASTLTEVPPVAARLRVSVAQGDPGGSITVTAFIED